MDFNKTASWIEVFCAYAINDNIFKNEDLIVGDCGNECLPDIYNVSKTLGIEVVQMEKDCDLDIKYIWKSYNENEGDFKKIEDFCNRVYPNNYILTENNGKLGLILTNGKSHFKDWMKDIYLKNLKNKLKKLNAGNYSGVKGDIILCISIIHRIKSLYDVHLILYLYLECIKEFNSKFDKILVVTYKKLYLLDTKKGIDLFPIIEKGAIVDFDIKGTDYLITFDYDYTHSHELASIQFPSL